MKNIGLVIVMYIAVVLGFTMIAGILQIAITVLSMDADMQKTVDFLEVLQRINLFNSSATIGLGNAYKLNDLWYYLVTPLVATSLFLGHGVWKFNKKDLK